MIRVKQIAYFGLLLSSVCVAQTPTSLTEDARAYQAHLLTFKWDEAMNSETIDYETLVSLAALPKIAPATEDIWQDTQSMTADINALQNPFDDYAKQLTGKARLLTNDRWILIFDHTGDSIERHFHSSPPKQGYAELMGRINIKLGRYLETTLRMQHLQFHSVEHTDTLSETDHFESDTSIIDQPNAKLDLVLQNRTASKKLNYIDHPIIGALLYFEPMELQDAQQALALESLLPTSEILAR